MNPRFPVFLFFFLCFFQVFSQDKFNDKFNDANLLMEEKLYAIALPVWLEILQTDTNSANWNYKVGICYLNSANERARSLPYLEKAALKTVKNYNPFSPTEDRAPMDAYYYLAKSYHLNNQFDAAIEYYDKFRKLAGKKHFLNPEVDLGIQMCNNAREIMSKPLTVNITNVGDIVNTSAPEYGPLISLDERALYFTSRRLWLDSSNAEIKDRADGVYFEDIYVSYKDMSGKWGNPEMLNFNRRDDHEATVSLAPDGQTIYLYMDDGGDGNLYQSFLFGETWTAPVPLDPGINTKSQETHMTVSLDNKTLYFVSDRKGGTGGKDIYFCTRLPNGKWSQPQNIGMAINTPYDEDGPFIHPDGKTLYFSSKGHKSMGGYDIFMSIKNDDGTWAAPENIGYPINTTDDDIFFIISPDGKRAYYSSFRPDGMGDKDIYMVEQPQAMEKQLALIKGYITVPEGEEMPEDIAIIITNNETGEFVTEIRPLKRNGSFVFVIPPGKNYNISYTADGNEFYNENVYVPLNSDYKEVDKIIALNPKMLGTQEAVKINVVSSTDKPKPDWLIRYREPGHSIPDSSYIHYLNADGSVIYEELLSKSGFFNYYELEKSQPYIFTLKQKDSPLCKNGEIVLVGGSREAKFLPDSDCIFKEAPSKMPRFLFNTLGMAIPAGITIQYLDAGENVIYEEVLGKNGEFALHEAPSDSAYIIKLAFSDSSLCKDARIEIPKKNGEIIVLTADKKCIFRLRQQKPKFDFSHLEKKISGGFTVQYLNDAGKVIFEEKANPKGEFAFHQLPATQSYMMRLKKTDQTLCDEGEITMPGPGGTVLTLVADENCVFRVTEKKSKFIYEKLDKEMAEGLTVQILDDKGNILAEEKLNDRGEFSYYKLPPDKEFTIKLVPYNPDKFKNTEIIIPSYGKKFYKFKPDESGVFRMTDAREDTIIVQKGKEEEKEEEKKEVIETKEKEKEIVKEEEKPLVQPGTVVYEKTVMFDYDKSDIAGQYRKELEDAVKILKTNPSYKVEISGHTDSKGTDEYNNALSKRRAESAARYFASKGISGSRIISKGFGEAMPIAPNVHPDGSDNPEGRQKNRRIEIKVLS